MLFITLFFILIALTLNQYWNCLEAISYQELLAKIHRTLVGMGEIEVLAHSIPFMYSYFSSALIFSIQGEKLKMGEITREEWLNEA